MSDFAGLEAADAPTQSGILRAMVRLLTLVGLGNGLIVVALLLARRLRTGNPEHTLADRLRSAGPWWSVEVALLVGAAVLTTAALYTVLKRLQPRLEANALRQARFLDTLDPKSVDVAIVSAAALSLFLELAVIRWQSSVLEFLALYKNFSLVACFAGLGLGYALATRSHIPLVTVIPLLAWQFCFILAIRLLPWMLGVIPFREQLTMGLGTGNWYSVTILYLLLSVIFVMTALTFLPIGQLCGRLMERCGALRAYGLNLLGSLGGVLVMLALSHLWTPPLVWFALCFLGVLLFHVRRPSTLVAGASFTLLCVVVLGWWPIDPLWNRIYSPYQLLEVGTDRDTGLTLIRAAGHYYQRVNDFASDGLSTGQARVRDYYDFPYRVRPRPADVAVVGAGTGNDVAAALRAGAGSVDAIEIDPAILWIGKLNHPEKPYDSQRTRAVVNDARSFLRGTDRTYDMIVYGLLDSHTLLSHGSSVRLDSFVYTVEGLREARNRLKPDGVIALSFSVISDALGRKIYLMLQQAFDGRPPVSVATGYDRSVIFLISNDKNWTLPPGLLANTEFGDRTAFYANPSLQASVSTDDWPFFYMPRRIYPVSYLVMILQIALLSVLLIASFFGESPRFSHLSFFFLGAGFMLVETKAITEMGLTFGNTWHVIGIVIAGILTMAFLGNCLVQWLDIKRSFVPYLFLWAALALGWLVAGSGGFASTPVGRLETAVVLTLPLLFSGIVFSTMLSAAHGQVSGIMAMNLLGAVCGGLLEYNSMYFGFRALYVMAMVCYVVAFASKWALQAMKSPVR